MKLHITLSIVTIVALSNDTLSANDKTKLGEIIVNETYSNSSENAYTIKESSSATKLDLSLKETPQSISVITKKQIEDQNLEDIDSVLLNTPGITKMQMGGTKSSGHASYFSRGMTIQNASIDGVPLSSASFDYSNFTSLENAAIYERVEVIRGSTGLTNGNGNPSASINYVRKKPTKEFQGNTKVSYGSWDAYKGQIDISGGLNESKSIRGRLVTSYGERDSQQERYHQKNSLLYGALDFDLSDNTLLTAAATYQKVDADGVAIHHTVPFYTNGIHHNLRVTKRGSNPAAKWSYANTEKTNLQLGLEHYFNDNWKSIINYSYTKSKSDRLLGLSRTIVNYDTGNIEGIVQASKNTPEVHSIDLYTSGSFKLLNREHKISFGANGYNLEADDPAYKITPNSINTPYLGYDGNIPKPIVTENGRTKVDSKQIGAFAVLDLELLDPLHLILGSRFSNFERINNKDKETEQKQKHNGEFTPYAGLIYDINQNFAIYTSYTSIFNPTTAQNTQGNYLDPEEGNTVEFGLNATFYDGRLNASIAYFITKQDNLAVSDTPNLTPEGNTAYKSVDGAKIKGWDLTISGEVLPNWNISGGYTYTDAKDRDGERLNAFQVPKQTFKLFTTYKYDNLTIGGGVNWQSETHGVYPPLSSKIKIDTKQKAYAVVNAMAKYDINKNINVQFNANNIFDEKYRYVTEIGGYGDERNYTLSLSYKF